MSPGCVASYFYNPKKKDTNKSRRLYSFFFLREYFFSSFFKNMSTNARTKVKRSIYNIFTKKYGLHVQTDATRYLEEMLINEVDVIDSIEKIIKAYKKRFSGTRSIHTQKKKEKHKK